MLRSKRPSSLPRNAVSASKIIPVCCAALATSVAGCSADVSRFDSSLFSSTDSTGSINRNYPAETMNLSDQQPSYEYGGAGLSNPRVAVERRALPYASSPVTAPQNTAPSPPPVIVNRSEPQPAPRQYADASPFRDTGTLTDAGTSGGTVVVQPGDTLYGIARRNNVSVSDLKSTNGLTSNIIQPGQSLALPGASNSVTRSARRTVPVEAESSASRADLSDDDVYTVRPGDSLYRISRATGVSVDDLKSINGISDARRIRPGQELRLRTSGSSNFASAQPAPRQGELEVAARGVRTTTVVPEVINTGRRGGTLTDTPAQTPKAGDRLASLNDKPNRPSVTAAATGFRWPVRGHVRSGFGPRPDGTHNDGIDIDVPMGADVRAAADGVVAYANNELEAYGNLILIRHDNGWVSAYAHADRLLVKRGDTIKRGQVIAKAGKTGAVDRPTLHFELREGAKPVNPVPHLPPA